MRSASEGASRGPARLSAAAAAMDYLPVFLRLDGHPVVVVGGGTVALRKAAWLRRAGARVTVVAPGVHAELAQQAARGELRQIAEEFTPEHLAGAVAVVAATADRATNASVAARARERGVPVNVVDDAELSTFIFPAIVDRSPIVVAVSSGGHAPVLARRVREQIEALLPGRLGALARFMGAQRRSVHRALRAFARRGFWERVASGPVATQLLRGDAAQAERALGRELLAAQLTVGAVARLGEVYLIGAGPGDPDLLTLRALQLLQQAQREEVGIARAGADQVYLAQPCDRADGELRGEELAPERPLRLCGVPAQQLRGDGTRGDTLPEAATGEGAERAVHAPALRAHEARERAETPGKQRLDLLAHAPREHRRMSARAHRDDDRRAIDDRRKDEGRELGVIDDVDRHAPLARAGCDACVRGAIRGGGDDGDGSREMLGRELFGNLPQLAACGLLRELRVHARRHDGHAGARPAQPRRLAQRNRPAAHHHDGMAIEAQEDRQVIHGGGRRAQAGRAAGGTLGCRPHSRVS